MVIIDQIIKNDEIPKTQSHLLPLSQELGKQTYSNLHL